ncbi:MAG TPA: hypothetical protein ENI44_01885 [Thermoplasmatales archaeon]|nr:hypothetical protein [Thermoplasmatales archaeon]
MNHHKNSAVMLMLRKAFIFYVAVVVLLSLPTATRLVRAADIIVDDDGTGDYTNIQDAINAASDGDTIWVKDGSYNEQLTVDKSVRILADNGAHPIIYATTWVPSITVTAPNVTISGFKIYGNSGPSAGATILASTNSDNLKITSNTFTVIAGETGNITLRVITGIKGVSFSSNVINDYNIGVYLEPNSEAYINGNTYSDVSHEIFHAAHTQGEAKYYGSIQDAIDESENESLIEVTPGFYSENLIVNKSIVLRGAMFGINPVDGRSGSESIIDGNTQTAITISSKTEGVTIDGFTLRVSSKSSGSNEAGVIIGPGTNDITIKNNIIEDITDGVGADTITDESYGIMVYGRDDAVGGQTNITIEDNLIHNVEEYGIAINDNTSFVTMTGNKIVDLIGSDHSADPFWDPSWPYTLICSAIHLGGQVGPVDNITIEDNILSTNVTGDGVTAFGGAGISFAGVDEMVAPNRPWAGFENIYISYNRIVNNSIGVFVLTGKTNNEITVHGKFTLTGNNLSSNTLFGIYNVEVNATVNATNNWWGDITGPYNATENPGGLGTNVSGNVTFWPWYEFGTYQSGYSLPPHVDYVVDLPKSSDEYVIRDFTQIHISAQDNESGLKSLTYRIWNTTHRWSPWMNYTGPFTLSGEGIHKVQYNATDNAGKSIIDTRVHRVDDEAPLVHVIYPNGGEALYGTINITWSAADEIFDQGVLDWNDSMPLTADYPGHIQSFIPTEDSIRSVQLLLYGDDATVSVKLFSSIFPVPTSIAQSTLHLQNIGSPSAPVWVDFPFDSDVELNVGQTYYIGVIQEIHGDTGFNWYLFNSSSGIDPYDYGHAWIKETDTLVNASNLDWCFKTMYWHTDIDVTIQYSNTGVSPWSTIAENVPNTGVYYWDTVAYGVPDSSSYRVRVLALDEIQNMGTDESDGKFIIDNGGISIYNIVITDTTVGSTEYVKDGDTVMITATVTGDPTSITADLTGFGYGSAVNASFAGGTATWIISNVRCTPADGSVSITITAVDKTGDIGYATASITADNTPPTVKITKPLPGLYIMDSMRLLPFSYPFIIGQITVEADASDDGSGVKKVEFILENEVEANVSEPPYTWLWDRAATGFFKLAVKAYDNVGHTSTDEISDLFIINFDIVGHRS